MNCAGFIGIVDELISDDRITDMDKVYTLNNWIENIHEKISRSIMHSSELKEINDVVKYIQEKKETLIQKNKEERK